MATTPTEVRELRPADEARKLRQSFFNIWTLRNDPDWPLVRQCLRYTIKRLRELRT